MGYVGSGRWPQQDPLSFECDTGGEISEKPWEDSLQGRVKTELEHSYFPWGDRKTNEQSVHKLQNKNIGQLSRMDVQNMGRYQ